MSLFPVGSFVQIKGKNYKTATKRRMSPDATQRRITIRTDAGVQHYTVVQVERTDAPNSYLLRIDSRDGAWLAAGAYAATITGKQEASGSLALIDYLVMDDGILFVGLFNLGNDQAT